MCFKTFFCSFFCFIFQRRTTEIKQEEEWKQMTCYAADGRSFSVITGTKNEVYTQQIKETHLRLLHIEIPPQAFRNWQRVMEAVVRQRGRVKTSCAEKRERKRDRSTLCNITTYDSCRISVSAWRDASRPLLYILSKASISFFSPQPWRRRRCMTRPSCSGTGTKQQINIFISIYKTFIVRPGSATYASFSLQLESYS